MKKFLSIIIAVLWCCVAMAQENVNWDYSAKTLANGDIQIKLTANIKDGFRLYSPYNPEGASMPLEIILDESNNYSQKGKIVECQKPTEHYEEIFDVTEKFFKGKASFVLTIAPQTLEPFDVTGKLRGQVCNDDMFCAMVQDNFSIKATPLSPQKEDPKKQNQSDISNSANNSEASGNDGLVADTAKNDSEASGNDGLVADTAKNNGEASGNDGLVADTAKNNSENSNSKSDNSLWTIFFIAFLAGLAAIFTPCVFPMIPMTVSYFLKDKTGKGKFNALIYGVAIVALYTLPVAILILLGNWLGGENFTAGVFNALSTHWLPNIIFFVIFMIFALSFLGMFEIVLPSGIINKADQRSSKGGIVGIFFLAFVLVLVSFSCTGPIVGSVLVESASGGGNNYLKPIVAILGFSIAFAMPFTLFAFFPEAMKKLPKSGGWLNTVKVVLGFVELALGFKFISVADQTYHWHLLDRETYLAIWIAIGLLLTMYLLGKLKLPNDDDVPFLKVPRLILAIITLSFTIYMIPGLWGAPLKALSGYIPPITTQDFVLGGATSSKLISTTENNLCSTPKYSDILRLPHGMAAYFEYNEALECAKSKNKPLLIVFTGHGCVNCRKMEENVWSDLRVKNSMQNDFVLCALYTDDRTISQDNKNTIGEINTEIQISKFKINAQPYYVILDAKNPDVTITTPQGYNPDVDSFIEFLNKGKEGYKN